VDHLSPFLLVKPILAYNRIMHVCDLFGRCDSEVNYTRRHLALYFVMNVFANVRKLCVKLGRITCALSIICAVFVYIHRVDRDNYRTFPAGSQPCALTFWH